MKRIVPFLSLFFGLSLLVSASAANFTATCGGTTTSSNAPPYDGYNWNLGCTTPDNNASVGTYVEPGYPGTVSGSIGAGLETGYAGLPYDGVPMKATVSGIGSSPHYYRKQPHANARYLERRNHWLFLSMRPI